MQYKFDFSERTAFLPLLDAYLSCKLSKNFHSALEIGVYKGGWLFNLSDNVPNILTVGIDPYPNLDQIKQNFISECGRRGLNDSISLYSSFDELQSSDQRLLKFDIIHCDGEHTQSQAILDLNNSLLFLDEAGILIIDDIFYHSYPGVTAAAFSFIGQYNLSPFLFTQKKLYVCNSKYYEYYYAKAFSILSALEVNFEVSEPEDPKQSYKQSNSIFGYNLIITSEQPHRTEFNRLCRILEIRIPLLIKMKTFSKIWMPPIIYDLILRVKKIKF